MWEDEILEELYRIREEHAKSFNYDFKAIFADLQKQQAESGRKLVSLQPKQVSNNMINSRVRVDIAVYGKDKQLKLVIEVKARRGTTIDWAAELRRNLYVNQFIPEVPFYLVALPEQFYLWKNIKNPNEIILPDYKVDPKPFLSSYYSLTEWDKTNFSKSTFVLIMMGWLNQIINLETPETLDPIYKDWLVNSGLYEAIQGGDFQTEVSLENS